MVSVSAMRENGGRVSRPALHGFVGRVTGPPAQQDVPDAVWPSRWRINRPTVQLPE